MNRSALLALALSAGLSTTMVGTAGSVGAAVDERPFAGAWSAKVAGVQAREDAPGTVQTKSAWQFRRGEKGRGKRQVRVVVSFTLHDAKGAHTGFGDTASDWERLDRGERAVAKVELPVLCYKLANTLVERAEVRVRRGGAWQPPVLVAESVKPGPTC